jgi:hypothetical protein
MAAAVASSPSAPNAWPAFWAKVSKGQHWTLTEYNMAALRAQRAASLLRSLVAIMQATIMTQSFTVI